MRNSAMRLATPFDPIEIGEIDDFAFDFTADMGAATLVSTSWTCALAPSQTAIQLRAPADGSLQTCAGFFSVASIGGMPITAAGGTYILEATAALSDGRVLKLNATILCKAPGP